MVHYPIFCKKCNRNVDTVGKTLECPICGFKSKIDWSRMCTSSKIYKPVIFDHFSEGKGSPQQPVHVTSERQLKELYKGSKYNYIGG